MKTGKNLEELAKEIIRQNDVKQDYLTPARKMAVRTDSDGVTRLQMDGVHREFDTNTIFHEQTAEELAIHKSYYDRMRKDAPVLFDTNVNHWLGQGNGTVRRIRTLDHNARANLSNKYRSMDYFDLAQAVFPILAESKVEVKSSEITEKKLYIKVGAPGMRRELAARVGEVIEAGVSISNSEVGFGKLVVAPFIFVLRCTNGLIGNDSKIAKRHIGKAYQTDEATLFVTDKTRAIQDAALFSEIQDVVKGMFQEKTFDEIIGRLDLSFSEKVDARPDVAVKVLQKQTQLNDTERDSILNHWLSGHAGKAVEMNRFGLVMAITRAAEDVTDYDRATELERLGGKVLELPKSDWRLIAEAA